MPLVGCTCTEPTTAGLAVFPTSRYIWDIPHCRCDWVAGESLGVGLLIVHGVQL